jgi:16S rRNA (cytidine1402-2'-O)-methyltransferase
MLSFIPTPIGNKEDITLRALRLFRELEVFFCEDTRTFMNLLRMYDIPLTGKQFHAFGSFNSPSKLHSYIAIAKNQDCGVVSEAGTPGLSDPGKTLIQICNEHTIPFDVLP